MSGLLTNHYGPGGGPGQAAGGRRGGRGAGAPATRMNPQQMKDVASCFDDGGGHDPDLDHVMGDSSSGDSERPPVVKKANIGASFQAFKAAKKLEGNPKQIQEAATIPKTQNKPNKEQKSLEEELKDDQQIMDVEYGAESSLSGDSNDMEDSDSDESVFLNGGKFGVIKTTKSGMYDFKFLKDAAFLAKSAEEQAAFIELQLELRLKRQMMKTRHDDMASIDDFLKPLLTGDLLRDHAKLHSVKDFRKKGIPVNFKGGHQEYLEIWRELFLYEVFNILINSRRANAKEEEHADAQNMANRRGGAGLRAKRSSWPGYAVCGLAERGFQTLRLYDQPPHANEDATAMKDRQHGRDNLPCLRAVRDDDVLLLSATAINMKGKDDIKQVGGVDFLIETLNKPGTMLAFVAQKWIKGNGFVQLLVDGSKSQYLDELESADSYAFMYCYHLESLATTIREFKTLKMSEFCKMAPILHQPTLSLAKKDEMVLEHEKTMEEALNPNKNTNPPTRSWSSTGQVKPVDVPANMRKYLQNNKSLYNPSQTIVLEKVIDMPENDILLIQGPPGTGKTHTITGIVSMLMSSGAKKILICAPSNAAVDEIVTRVAQRGFVGFDSNHVDRAEATKIESMLLRIGAMEYTPSEIVKKHTLDDRLVRELHGNKIYDLRAQIAAGKEVQDIVQAPGFTAFRVDDKHVVTLLQQLVTPSIRRLKDWIIKKPVDEQLSHLTRQLARDENRLADLLSGENQRQQGGDWQYVENSLMLKSQLVCCTLSMAGIPKMVLTKDLFDYLIVDEACQCTEPATLIPFQLCPKRVILVGDQNQLPATTFSDNSNRTNFCRSLFERLLQSGYDKTMLTIQYRMHPSIRKFPSDEFYDGLIHDHESIMARQLPPQLQDLAQFFGSRMIFFDVQHAIETVDDKSKCNYGEAEFTQRLVELIAHSAAKRGSLKPIKGQIGVISPYKSQVRQLKNRLGPFCRSHDCSLQETIEVNTVDAFQGREKDIIIFNCVRSNDAPTLKSALGFLIDERRLNVAITRPKFFLFVVGNAKTLSQSEVWKNMIEYCRSSETASKFVELPSPSHYATHLDLKDLIHSSSTKSHKRTQPEATPQVHDSPADYSLFATDHIPVQKRQRVASAQNGSH